MLIFKFLGQLSKGHVTLLGDPVPNPIRHGRKLSGRACTLLAGLQRTRFTLPLDHVVDELHRHIELSCNGPMSEPLLDKRNSPLTQFNR